MAAEPNSAAWAGQAHLWFIYWKGGRPQLPGLTSAP